eukprot:COSAG02_NODE_1890_length_10490_cov_68.177461_2_plen_190_part_00
MPDSVGSPADDTDSDFSACVSVCLACCLGVCLGVWLSRYIAALCASVPLCLRASVSKHLRQRWEPVCGRASRGSKLGGSCGQGNSLAAREVSRLAASGNEGEQGAGTMAPAGDVTVEQLHEAARAGSAQAQNELGRRYDSGDGVQKDRNAALLFLKLAADQGLAAAQNSLAETLCARLSCVALLPRETL